MTYFLYLMLALGLGITVLVFALLLMVSQLGGWGKLAGEYALSDLTEKGALLEEKPQRKAWVGLNRFGTMVTARCYERGLELTVIFPFSPPLFFPWEVIRDYQRVSLAPFGVLDQFTVGGRRIRLSNHLDELEKRMAAMQNSA